MAGLLAGLDDAGGDGGADADEDEAAEQFAALAGAGPEHGAQFEPGQGHGHADRADDDGGEREADVVGPQGESDGKVVDAQRKPGDQQPTGPRPGAGRGVCGAVSLRQAWITV